MKQYATAAAAAVAPGAPTVTIGQVQAFRRG